MEICLRYLVLLSLCIGTVVVQAQRSDFPSGLEDDDIIEWTGSISKRALVYMAIRPAGTGPYFRLEIHAGRNRVAVKKIPSRLRANKQNCFLGKSYLRLNKPFSIQIRIKPDQYMIYMDHKLVFTLPKSVRPENVRRISVVGKVNRSNLKLLTNRDFAERINVAGCGKIESSGTMADVDTTRLCELQFDNTRIVNGAPAEAGSLPWQVSVRRKSQYLSSDKTPHQCGATLINSCWAVSAGHCFPVVHRTSLKRLYIRVGDYFNDDSDKRMNSKFSSIEAVQEFNIEAVYKHEGYTALPTARNDIALIKLAECATFGKLVKPACLPTRGDQYNPSSDCIISGWGAANWTADSVNHPKCLQMGKVSLLEENACALKYAHKKYDTDMMICAAGTTTNDESTVDACQGDSGGPLTCTTSNEQDVTLVGITSWGIRCGDRAFPGVYTNVASFMKWIYVTMMLKPSTDDLRTYVRQNKLAEAYCQSAFIKGTF